MLHHRAAVDLAKTRADRASGQRPVAQAIQDCTPDRRGQRLEQPILIRLYRSRSRRAGVSTSTEG
jgi:hypothetical protein